MSMKRYRRPRRSGPMVKVDVCVMAHEGDGEYMEHVFTGYAPYRGCMWVAVKPSWSKHWGVVHADTGYMVRRSIKTADAAKVAVGRMEKYWRNCSWETLMEHTEQVQRDLYYKRDEYVYRNAHDSNLYSGPCGWGPRDQATVWSAEQQARDANKMMSGEWELI